MTTFTYHTDPGHGWLEVDFDALIDAGLTRNNFSAYSYIKSDPAKGYTMYLEEDCDASKFVDAYVAKHGARPEFKEKHSDPCFVRDLPRNPVGRSG